MITYSVVRGDTLWSIARMHGIEFNDLLAANPKITNQNLIFPGQVINIPLSNNKIVTVEPGDTMWSIAKNHGIELSSLLAANPNITNQNLIVPGQKINIPTNDSGNDTTNNLKELESEVIRLVNVERSRMGQSPLTSNEELNKVARIKSQDFVDNNYFSHNSPVYGTPFEMLRSFGITYTAAAENIANGQRTAEEVMNSWMNSPNHRANILNPSYNQIGVGAARDSNGNLFWTQLFIRS